MNTAWKNSLLFLWSSYRPSVLHFLSDCCCIARKSITSYLHSLTLALWLPCICLMSFEAVQVVVYLYTLRSETSNVASFVLPNDSFISGHVLKKSPGVSWLSSLLRRDTQQFKILHSFSSCKCSYGVLHWNFHSLVIWCPSMCWLIQILFCLSLFQLLKTAIYTMSKQD